MVPQVLGTFGNGRVERFMERMRHLEPAEMARPDLVPLIARRLAQFHAVALGEEQQPQVFAIINKWCAWAPGRARFGHLPAQRPPVCQLFGTPTQPCKCLRWSSGQSFRRALVNEST